LAEDPRAIATGLASQLLTYGTGAPITYADRTDVKNLVDERASEGFGFRSLVAKVACSRLFTMK
jgi:hypothetical protein